MKTAIIDIIPRTGLTYDSTPVDKIWAAGANTGNAVWVDSIQEQITHDFLIPSGELENNSQIKYILPIANAINVSDPTLEKIYDLLCDFNVNIIPLGLGAQLSRACPTPGKLVAALSEKKIRALRYFGSHAEMLGVRGSITAECLDRLGIHNYRIIGCPSFFGMGTKGFPTLPKPSIDNIVFNLNCSGKMGEHRFVEFLLDKNRVPHTPSLVIQTINELFGYGWDGNRQILQEEIERRLPGADIGIKGLEDILLNHSLLFSSKKEWEFRLKENHYTFSVGGRFHGNMISLLAGIPAFWIVHDSRTRELTETLKLPCLPMERLNRIKNIEDLVDQCRYEETFYSNYFKIFEEYTLFLARNGLKLKQAVKGLR